MTSGEKIKFIRQKKAISQKELALRLGISQAAVSQFEKSTQSFKMSTLKKIAEALEVNVFELYDDLSDEQKIALMDANRKAFLEKTKEILNEDHNGSVNVGTVIDFFSKKDNEYTPKPDLDSIISKCSVKRQRVNELMDQLNDKGQDKAIEHLEMISKIDDYTK